MLGLAGGVLGVALGLVGAVVVPLFSDSRVILSVPAGIGAIAMAIGIGVDLRCVPRVACRPARPDRRAQERMTAWPSKRNPLRPRRRSRRARSRPPPRDRLASLFPDPDATPPSWWHKRRKALIVVVVLALIASGVLVSQAFGANDASYVTATVATHNVDALLNGVGLVEPVSQASVAFPSSGTVATVDVQLGDPVTVGQTLATLDPQALSQALHEKQATLAQAQLTLQKALSGQSVSGVGTGSSGIGSSRSSGTSGASSAAAASTTSVVLTAMTFPHSSNPQIAAAQQNVLAAQHKVDTAVDTATQALDSATSVCQAGGIGTTPPGTPTPAQLAACQTATQQVLTAQGAVSVAQHQLVAASNALDLLLTQQATTSTTTPSGGGSGSGSSRSGSGSGTSTGSGSARSTGATGSSPSAADLIAYQKAVDAAQADVAVAEQAIAQATIVSPIAGTVQAVNLAVGDTVTAGSTTSNIVVVGPGGYEVTTTVSVDKVTSVKVGQPATFLPDGSKRPLAGKVSSISIAPDASATTSTSYRVVVGLTDPDASLNNGSTGSLAIVTKSSRSALAVPTSAVTTVGTRHLVNVLKGNTPERTLVQVGVVGDTWTEITNGVKPGQRVVLANLAAPLPGSATDTSGSTTNRTTTGGFGGFGGFGGGAGGGFGGGFTRAGG